jgi:hypothetical protein
VSARYELARTHDQHRHRDRRAHRSHRHNKIDARQPPARIQIRIIQCQHGFGFSEQFHAFKVRSVALPQATEKQPRVLQREPSAHERDCAEYEYRDHFLAALFG